MEENERKGKDTQVCRYSALSDPLRFPQRLAYSWQFWYDSWADYNFKSHSYNGNDVLVICRWEIHVVSNVLKSSLEFSTLGCLKPTLAGKSSNRIPASYGNCAIKIKKTNYIYAITKLYTLTNYYALTTNWSWSNVLMVFTGHRIIQGSHSLEKSLNLRGRPWKVLEFHFSLKSP